jgi:glycerol-3-phosphate dehydrogenase
VLKLDKPEGQAPILSVFGGKITTARKLAESVMDEIKPFFPEMKGQWTAHSTLPGGDIAYDAVENRIAELQRKYSFLKPANIRRLFRAYGTEVESILGDARFAADLGAAIGPLTAKEIEHLKSKEWAVTADDILWRRSKLGLHMKPDEQDALRVYMEGETKVVSAKKKKKET